MHNHSPLLLSRMTSLWALHALHTIIPQPATFLLHQLLQLRHPFSAHKSHFSNRVLRAQWKQRRSTVPSVELTLFFLEAGREVFDRARLRFSGVAVCAVCALFECTAMMRRTPKKKDKRKANSIRAEAHFEQACEHGFLCQGHHHATSRRDSIIISLYKNQDLRKQEIQRTLSDAWMNCHSSKYLSKSRLMDKRWHISHLATRANSSS